MTEKTKKTELNEAELDQVQGGVGLLLPAVQAAREPASFKAESAPTKGSSHPIENFSLNYTKIEY